MKKKILPYLLILVLFTVLYICIGRLCGSDWPAHAKGWLKVVSGERPIGFRDLFFVFVGLFSLFQNSKPLAFAALCFCAAMATTYRFYLARTSLMECGLKRGCDERNSKVWSYWLAFSLLFIYAIPIPNYLVNGYFFAGGFPTNVWNNSTTLAVFPFAILLFNVSAEQLTSTFSIKKTLLLVLLMIVNISIKPSFFFVYVVAYPLMCLLTFGLKKDFWLRISPLILGVMFLTVYYIYIYGKPSNGSESSVALEPFAYYQEVGQLWELPISFVFAYLFPLSYCFANKKAFKDKEIQYSFFCVIFAIAIYLLFIETGPRRLHGNFQWQLVLTSWIFFFVCTKKLYVDILSRGFERKNIILSSLYLVHVIFGILYLVKYFVTGEPY